MNEIISSVERFSSTWVWRRALEPAALAGTIPRPIATRKPRRRRRRRRQWWRPRMRWPSWPGWCRPWRRRHCRPFHFLSVCAGHCWCYCWCYRWRYHYHYRYHCRPKCSTGSSSGRWSGPSSVVSISERFRLLGDCNRLVVSVWFVHLRATSGFTSSTSKLQQESENRQQQHCERLAHSSTLLPVRVHFRLNLFHVNNDNYIIFNGANLNLMSDS